LQAAPTTSTLATVASQLESTAPPDFSTIRAWLIAPIGNLSQPAAEHALYQQQPYHLNQPLLRTPGAVTTKCLMEFMVL
jgi:hypothetical protein